MMKRNALLLLLALVPVTTFAESTGRYIVVTTAPARNAIRSLRGDNFEPGADAHVRSFTSINGFAADLTESEVAELKRSRHVRWVEPVVDRYVLADTIVDGTQTIPFGVHMVHAPEVWPVTKGLSVDSTKRPINVVVIDTGIRYTMNELKGVYKGGYNVLNGTDNPMDDHGHGTHVSGTIAAADDGTGVVGIAPAINLWGVKNMNECGKGNSEDSIRAMDWVVAKKAEIGGNWVVNMSYGWNVPSAAERIAIQRATSQGVLVFAASGNGYDDNPVEGIIFPAGYPEVVSVGAVDSTATVAPFSQRGPSLKLVAPGLEVLSPIVAPQVGTNDGRSFAVSEFGAATSTGDTMCFSHATITANVVFAGYGRPGDFPAGVAGKIALIERGLPEGSTTTMTFAEKAKNAKLAGAVGAIIYNNVDGGLPGFLGTLTSPSLVPYTVGMSREDGLALRATSNAVVTMSFGRESYSLGAGTSMASPHAAGVGALVWAVAPGATASQVATAILDTATDLGAPGVDNVYGYGVPNAFEAAKRLNNGAFHTKGDPTKWRSGH
jgi:subtilisin family serine protease